MSSSHGHEHQHGHNGKDAIPTLLLIFSLGLVFFVAELGVALLSGGIAVKGDAFHSLSHAGVAGGSLLGLYLSTRFASRRLAALIPVANFILLGIVGAWIISQGIARLEAPREVLGLPVILVSALDISSKLLIIFISRNALENRTVLSVILHFIFDALASAVVLVSAVVLTIWDLPQADAWGAVAVGSIAVLVSLWFLVLERLFSWFQKTYL